METPNALDTTATKPRKKKSRRWVRGYSRDFTKQADSHRYLLEAIPKKLWAKAQSRARRKGLSMRAAILQLLTEWIEQP